jgi:cell division protein FtsB
LWHWINSYGGLSDLRKSNEALRKSNEEFGKSNEELRKETEALKQQNAKLAELESKLDIVLQPYASNLNPTSSTDSN